MTNSKFSLIRILWAVFACLLMIFPIWAQERLQESIDGLKSPDPRVRITALERLGKMKSQPALDAVLSMLDDSGSGVKFAAIRAAGFQKNERAAETLLGFLDDSDSDVNQSVVWALGEIGDGRAVEPLLRLVGKGNLSFKVTVAHALSGFQNARAFEPLYRMLMESGGSSDFERAIIRLGPAAVEPLCRKVMESDDRNRFFVVGMLAAVADERAIPTLVWLIETHQENVPIDKLAGKIGMPAIDALLKLSKSENLLVRANAASVIGQIRDERSLKALLSMLGDTYPGVRLKVVEGLANFADSAIAQVLVSALGDENYEVRLKVIDVLAKLVGDDIEKALNELINNPKLQFEIALVWGRKQDLRALPFLIEALKKNDLGRANEASLSLFLIGKLAVDELIIVLLDKNKEYPEREIIYWRAEAKRERELAKRNRFPIFRCGTGYVPPVIDPRRRAAQLLGRIGDPRAIEPLRKVLKDKSAGLREDAVQSLMSLGYKQFEGQ